MKKIKDILPRFPEPEENFLVLNLEIESLGHSIESFIREAAELGWEWGAISNNGVRFNYLGTNYEH